MPRRVVLEDEPVLIFFLQCKAAELKDPTCAHCCPDCLYTLCKVLRGGPMVDAACQPACHDFWNACIKVVTTPRTNEELAALRETLRANAASCPGRAIGYHQYELSDHGGELEDPVHRLFHALYQCLVTCLAPSEGRRSTPLSSRSGPKKTFGNKHGRWPSHPNDLVPLGARKSAEMHLHWACQLFSPIMAYYLEMLIAGCRSLVFPHLLEPPLRERLVWAIVQMLNADTRKDNYSWPTSVPYARPARLSNWLCASQSYMSVYFAEGLMNVIFHGPDAKSDDMTMLCAGFEAALMPALNNALDLVQQGAVSGLDKGDLDQNRLCQLAVLLHKQLPHGELHVLAQRWRISNSVENTDPFDSLQGRLNHRYFSRTCCGPACTNGVPETRDGKPLPLCSGCKFTQYCCKGCQMADWKRAPLPHKELCPVLRVLRPVLEKDTSEFEDVLLGLDWEKLNLERFMRWLTD